jgi:glycine/D-amino acid oxidase-like deaminating enzyme
MLAPSGGSLWHDTLPSELRRARRPLDGDTDVDVVIVGAGYTGLWTAYYLARHDPRLRVVVLERAHVGFGASGRNGGWCSSILPMSLDVLAQRHGHDAAVRMQRAMVDTVGEIQQVADTEGIDCHFHRGGWIQLARNHPQVARARRVVDELRRYGATEDAARWLDPGDARELIGATSLLGASFVADCAALHPARLVHGLAAAVERRGVRICEGTAVSRIEPRRAVTERGTVRAEVVVRATEGFTAQLPGHRRDLIPVYSLMVATPPLDDETWEAIGLRDRPVFNEAGWSIVYGQRTADGRIAFGGRGAPYHFGSAIRPRFDHHDRVRERLHHRLGELFPVLRDVELTHHWGGPLGIPRDWHCSVRLDRTTGLASAGGYVGDGVATANLAGRTLADLVLGRDTELTELPWVGHRSPRWEPEPLRWLAVNAAVRLPEGADRHEHRTDRPARVRARILTALTGH